MPLKTEHEIKQELIAVRKLLDNARNDEDEQAVWAFYCAQQALGWVLGELCSVSKLEDVVMELANTASQLRSRKN